MITATDNTKLTPEMQGSVIYAIESHLLGLNLQDAEEALGRIEKKRERGE